MDTQTAQRLTDKYPLGEQLAEGKTKKIIGIKGQPDLVILAAKDDITAGDGAKRDLLEGKGALATQTTCNVFRLLSACGIPVAYQIQDTMTSFVAHRCAMLPYEVVVRREAHGSYLKRNPHISKGHLFPQLVVEFFLKTSGKKWKEVELSCDDPLLMYKPDEAQQQMWLFDPSKPIHGSQPFRKLNYLDIVTQPNEKDLYPEMARIARQAFLVLEKAWQIEGRTLVDFKVELGITTGGALLLADVIDNDSWRILDNGAHIDKQVYRDGGDLGEVLVKYQQVASLTDHFRIPRQRIVLWKGSGSDNVEAFMKARDALGVLLPQNFDMPVIICSTHKEPERAIGTLRQMLQDVPDSVVIVYVGMSNAAGPVLSAGSMAPVITVPASFDNFHDDVWSCLRVPSNVPVSTMLSPANAFSAALRILAMRNPFFYAMLAEELEKRMVNTAPV